MTNSNDCSNNYSYCNNSLPHICTQKANFAQKFPIYYISAFDKMYYV